MNTQRMLSPLVLLTPLYRQNTHPAGEKEVEMLRFLHTHGFALVENRDHYPKWNFTHKGFLLGGDDEGRTLEMAYDGRWFCVAMDAGTSDKPSVEQAGKRLIDAWTKLCSCAEQ